MTTNTRPLIGLALACLAAIVVSGIAAWCTGAS